MALYIFAALLFWNPSLGGRSTTTDTVLHQWADMIAMQCGDTRECMRLAAIASEESRFAPYILDGKCNDSKWRLTNKVDKKCDHGLAFGPWQIQEHAWETYSGIDKSGINCRETCNMDLHVYVAISILQKNPHAWSVYTVAAAKADAYISTHTPPM
jgi:hypothetical protein